MEAEEAASQRIQGAGSCSGFTPGYKFDLRGHYRESFDGTYLITSVTHSISQSVGGDGVGFSTYENSFSCRPHAVPYRPLQVTPAPVIQGIHTATVVGEEGTEIDIDSYGSVLVHFPWDRDNKYSCRARVSQNWAGKEWGFFCAPRIGQEVLIQFVEGDPRRPIVIGRVYNAEQMPPYSDGEHSGIKSRSTPEGSASNFNEIRLEDSKGSELFYIHAEKDKQIQVENDRSMNVDHDDTVTIGNNRNVTVEVDHTESVGGSESLTVTENRERKVEGKETVTVLKDQDVSVSENRTVTVAQDLSHTVSGGWTVSVTEDLTETIEGGYTSTVTDEYVHQSKKITMTAEEEIKFETGDASITMKSDGNITISGAKITIEGSGDVEISGSNVKLN
jgi:type VI secretion system secreted protein VgrG